MKKVVISIAIITSILGLGLAIHQAGAYKYGGQKWPTNTVDFYLDIAGWDPALIQGPASTWNNAGSSFRLRLKGHNVYGRFDGKNTIGRYVLPDELASAVTYTYQSGPLHEVDTIFNLRYDAWGCCGEPNLYDVRSVMTHEFGHWLVLEDLYMPWDFWKTLFGVIRKGETWKRTLESDDTQGIRSIY